MGYRHTLGRKKILGIYFFVEKKFFLNLPKNKKNYEN